MTGFEHSALRDGDTADGDVVALRVDVLPGGDRFQHVAEFIAQIFGVFDHDDRIGSFGDLAAGGDRHTGGFRKDPFLVLPHQHFSRIGDHGGQRFGAAVGVRGPDRKAVHRGTGVGRQVFRAQDVLRDDFVERVRQADGLYVRRFRDLFENDADRFFSRNYIQHGLFVHFLAHSEASPRRISSPWRSGPMMYSRLSLTAFGLPGMLTMSVCFRMPAAALESMPFGVMVME